MESILLVTPQFPPQAGPGVHRSLNFAKYLSDYGYHSHVLTLSKKDLKEKKMDQSLLKDLPENIDIQRSSSHFPYKTVKILMKLRIYRFFWFILYPFLWEQTSMWSFFAYKKAKRIISKHNIRIVYTSSSPFSDWILGYMLKCTLKVKWVADIRDPFTDGYMWLYPSKIHWHLARIFEKKMLAKADHIIVNTPEVKKLYLKRNLVPESKLTVITNGFTR